MPVAKRCDSERRGGSQPRHTPRITCLKGITNMDAHIRYLIFEELALERIKRKISDINNLLHSTNSDWNQTLIIAFFKVMGGFDNRTAMIQLAKTIGYSPLIRESGSQISIEALILGSAGLLDIYPEDSYLARLKQEATHLLAKYSIKPMEASKWQLHTTNLNNNPILRLVQIASALGNNMLTISSVTSCRRRKDVYKLFSGNISDYWVEKISQQHHASIPLGRRIGNFKCDIIGINLIVPITYAYRLYTSSTELNPHPAELLLDIPAESNIYTKQWYSYGTVATSALDSQALIQLTREYCEKGACDRCPFANYTL